MDKRHLDREPSVDRQPKRARRAIALAIGAAATIVVAGSARGSGDQAASVPATAVAYDIDVKAVLDGADTTTTSTTTSTTIARTAETRPVTPVTEATASTSVSTTTTAAPETTTTIPQVEVLQPAENVRWATVSITDPATGITINGGMYGFNGENDAILDHANETAPDGSIEGVIGVATQESNGADGQPRTNIVAFTHRTHALGLGAQFNELQPGAILSLTFTEPNGTADEAYATRQWVLTDTVNISQDDYDGLYAGFTMPETSGDTLALYACSNQDGTYNQPYLHDYRLITQWTPVTETEAVQG